LVAEAVEETDEEEVVEIVAALVDEVTDVPFDEPAEELEWTTEDEVVDVALVVVLVHKELIESGTVTPAVAQICIAYAMEAC